MNGARGKNFHHNAARDTQPSAEGARKIRESDGALAILWAAGLSLIYNTGGTRDEEMRRFSVVALDGSSLEC